MVTTAVENHYERTSGAVSLYNNFGRHKLNDGHAASASPQTRLFRSKDAVAGASVYQSARLFSGSRITLGLDYQHIYGRAYYTDRTTGEVIATPNKQSAHQHMNEWAAYAEVSQDLAAWLTVDAALRYDHHSVAGGEWVPQAGLVVRPISRGELKAMVSKGFRNPTLREMYLYPPSNEDLKQERLWNYEVSWRQRLVGNAISYGINLYCIEADNLIQTIERKNINTGHLSNRGVEIEGAWRIDRHWSLSTNHACLHMKHPVVGAPTYKGYLDARFSSGKWSAMVGVQQLCGLYTSVGEAETKEHATLLSATATYQLTGNLQLWAKGDNLLAQKYETNLGYPMPRATFMAGINLKF